MNGVRLTIGITTRNRPDALRRCLRSLAAVAHLSPEVIVFDDASSTPVRECLATWDVPLPVRVIRDDRAPGYIAGRNRLMREASTPAVLLMDDDAALVSGASIERALRVLESDGRVGAIAFAQCAENGARWDEVMQPSPKRRAVLRAIVHRLCAHAPPRRVHGHRRLSGVIRVRGEREGLLPAPDRGGLSNGLSSRRSRHPRTRPIGSQPATVPALRHAKRLPRRAVQRAAQPARVAVSDRLALYFRMRRAWNIVDPWGWAWILGELWKNRGSVYRDRKPVSRQTLQTWKRLRTAPQPYESPTLNRER